MEKIEIELHYKIGTRLYKVVNGELKFFDIEDINVHLTNSGNTFITYKLRINLSSGTREEVYGNDNIQNYYLTPEEAIMENSKELLLKFKEKESCN